MGRAFGHVLVLSALLLATGYVLQIDDSVRLPAPAPQRSVALSPSVLTRSDSTGREYFIKRHEIVPVGSTAIRLPILMYHYIRRPPSILYDPLGYRLSVAPEVFQVQMDWLHANGYHPVNFDQVRAYFAGTAALPPRPIVITLDDGYNDLYSAAFPILKAHSFTAVAYIVPNFVGQPAYASRDQILEMDRDGIQIASHTMNHADLAKMSYGSVMYELVQSKRWLETLLGHSVLDFAYPSGRFNGQVVGEVEQAGYDTAVTEQVSIMHSRADRYTWARVRVGGGEELSDFIGGLGPSMPSIRITNLVVATTGP